MASKHRATFPRLVPPDPSPASASSHQGRPRDDIYTLNITLLGSKPAIWRRLAVPGDIPLPKLHNVLQIVMGWYDSHLHRFITPDERYYGPRDPDVDRALDLGLRDERRYPLCELMPGQGARLLYEYDFGDSWEHDLEVVQVGPPEPDVRYPVCLAGARACPPEDCGGISGYARLLRVLANPKHSEHAEMLEWIGGHFDPEHFDPNEVNSTLRKMRLSR